MHKGKRNIVYVWIEKMSCTSRKQLRCWPKKKTWIWRRSSSLEENQLRRLWLVLVAKWRRRNQPSTTTTNIAEKCTSILMFLIMATSPFCGIACILYEQTSCEVDCARPRSRAYQIQSVADFYYQYKLVLVCLFFRANWNCKLNVNDFVVVSLHLLVTAISYSFPFSLLLFCDRFVISMERKTEHENRLQRNKECFAFTQCLFIIWIKYTRSVARVWAPITAQHSCIH